MRALNKKTMPNALGREEAKERVAFRYTEKFLNKYGFTCVRTQGKYDPWDVTAIKDGQILLVENKIRDVDLAFYKDEGVLVDYSKAVELIKSSRETALRFETPCAPILMEWFWVDNQMVVFNLDDFNIEDTVVEMYCSIGERTRERRTKKMCMIPLKWGRVYTLNLTKMVEHQKQVYNKFMEKNLPWLVEG